MTNQSRKNKLLIISGVFMPALGGPASLLANLIPVLIKRGYQITVLTYGTQKDDLPYKVVRISTAGNKLRWILRLFSAAVKLAKINDQIYTLDVYSAGFAAFLASKLMGRRLIARFTGDSAWETAYNRGWTRDNIVDFQKKFINLKISFIRRCRNIILKACDVIITDCYFLRGLLVSFGVEKSKIMVVHNSVEYLSRPKDFNKEQFKQQNQLKEKVILTICRLVPWKGVGTIMNLLPDLKKDFFNISFVSIGDGSELSKLKAEAEKMKNQHGLDIRFLGNLPQHEIASWYLSADVYVLNTNYEGIAHTLVEALYFRTPVVTTKAGGNPEIIVNEYNGLVVDYDNRIQLLQAIKRVLSDEDLAQRFRANGEEKLKGDFLWGKVVETNLRALQIS